MLAAVAAATAGCKSTTFTRLGMPVPVTEQGKTVVSLWQGSWIAAFFVGFLVWGAILWAVIFHRKRAGSDVVAPQVRYNLPIEILYTVVPFIRIRPLISWMCLPAAVLLMPVSAPSACSYQCSACA